MEEQNYLLWDNCSFGRLEEVREALQAGADPNFVNSYYSSNRTCLMEAARWGYDGVVALLLSSPGIRVNTKDEFDQTALHMVCRNYDFLDGRSLACLPVLLARPDLLLNERNDWGFTPIMSAILGRQTEAVLQMASLPNVCLDMKDNKGRSLEEIARL